MAAAPPPVPPEPVPEPAPGADLAAAPVPPTATFSAALAADAIPTIVYHHRPEDVSGHRSPRGSVRVGRPSPSMSTPPSGVAEEVSAGLRPRLRAFVLIYLFGFALHTARGLLMERPDVVSIALGLATMAVLGGVLAATSPRRSPGRRALRVLEAVAVGTLILSLGFLHCWLPLRLAHRGDPILLVSVLKDLTFFDFALMVTYGLILPNSWRKTAAVVVLIVATRLLARGALIWAYPDYRQDVRPLMTFEQTSDHLLAMLIGAAIAVYGAAATHRLRTEVIAARRLNQYRLGRKLGGGGMGEVFLAEHDLLKRPCALKLIGADRADDPEALARFEREVQTTARLTHPNTIEIFDFGHTSDGTFFYVMEYLPGLSLSGLVERHGPQPPGRVVYLIRQACAALGEAHAAGLVHRDIKPGNIIASQRGGLYDFAKLLDFGLVKAPRSRHGEASISRQESFVGSPRYMAPEQASGDVEPDHRADIYSLGGVMYYLLTGRSPFQGDSVVQLIVAHARDPVVPPSRLRPIVPADLERVVVRCLAKKPDERFPDIAALDAALAACACAADWSAESAHAWWDAFEPGSFDIPVLSDAPTEAGPVPPLPGAETVLNSTRVGVTPRDQQ